MLAATMPPPQMMTSCSGSAALAMAMALACTGERRGRCAQKPTLLLAGAQRAARIGHRGAGEEGRREV
jgi:hypothetical protein